ncbi:MAG: hypothetical protein KGK44_11690 [Gammaproteobacteria bacterium]|nr:hypothetical protein [Gammaproteobacteria bacterium]
MVFLSLLITGCATSLENADNFTGKIPKGMGLLVVAVDSTVPLGDLRFKLPDDTFAAVAARHIHEGRTVHFVLLRAGNYLWTRVDVSLGYGMSGWIDLDEAHKEHFTFSIQPGVINYPGDFVVVYHSGYHIELIDRTAMMLQLLSVTQRKIIKNSRLIYTGPGNDIFYDYYEKLPKLSGS